MKKRVLKRLIESGVVVGTIKLTQLAVISAEQFRGERQYGSEWLLPIIGLFILIMIEGDE